MASLSDVEHHPFFHRELVKQIKSYRNFKSEHLIQMGVHTMHLPSITRTPMCEVGTFHVKRALPFWFGDGDYAPERGTGGKIYENY